MMFLTLFPIFAHDFSFGVKLLGLSIHPKGAPNFRLLPWKLDSEGIVIFNPGVTLNFEYFVWRDIISIKVVQGLYGDCAMQFAGFSHLGFRLRFLKIARFSMNIGIGPTFYISGVGINYLIMILLQNLIRGEQTVRIGNISFIGMPAKLRQILM